MGLSVSKPAVTAKPVQHVSIHAHQTLDVAPKLMDRYEAAYAPANRQRSTVNHLSGANWPLMRLMEIVSMHVGAGLTSTWTAICQWFAACFTTSLAHDTKVQWHVQLATALQACKSIEEERQVFASHVGQTRDALGQVVFTQNDVEKYLTCLKDMRDADLITEDQYHAYEREFRRHGQ